MWFGWWIFFSPREAFWSLLEQINPLYHFPAEIIGNILNGSGFEGHRFVIVAVFFTIVIRAIFQTVMEEKIIDKGGDNNA